MSVYVYNAKGVERIVGFTQDMKKAARAVRTRFVSPRIVKKKAKAAELVLAGGQLRHDEIQGELLLQLMAEDREHRVKRRPVLAVVIDAVGSDGQIRQVREEGVFLHHRSDREDTDAAIVQVITHDGVKLGADYPRPLVIPLPAARVIRSLMA